MKLNLGCGKNHLADYLNCDKELSLKPDSVFDIEIHDWPWGANSVDEVLMAHVIEHVGQAPNVFLRIMQEVHRVLVPGGTLTIKTPHAQSGAYWGDPTHVRPVTPAMMNLFSRKNCAVYTENHWPNTPLAELLNVDLELKSTDYALTPYWAEKWRNGTVSQAELDFALATYWNVVDEVTMVLFKVA